MKDSKELLFESYMKLVGDEYAKIVVEEVDEEQEVAIYPDSLDHWFETYSRKRKRKDRKNRIVSNSFRYSRKIAAIFLAVFIVSSIVILNVEAVRIEFLNFFIREESNSIHIQSETKTLGEGLLEEYQGLYVLSYVPEGYVLDNIIDISENVTMVYLYQEKRIVFIQQKGDLDTNIDNERMKVTSYQLKNGENAILSESEDFTSIIWKNDTHTFIIEGKIDSESIIKMVENINYKK